MVSIMKKILSIMITALFVTSVLTVCIVGTDADDVDAATSGDWTDHITYEDKAWYERDPSLSVFTIKTAKELAYFSLLVNAEVEDFADKTILFKPANGTLDLSAHFWTPIGHYNPYSIEFRGTFDGDNNVIKGLTMTKNYLDGKTSLGLFGLSNGVIKNIGMVDSHVSGEYSIGSVVGENYGAVSNCYNTGDISGTRDSVGGVVGYSEGDITGCYNTGAISGTDSVGGVVGCGEGDITGCYNTGDVSGTGDYVGGIIGHIYGGNITDCYNTGDISGTDYIGGLFGYNDGGDVSNCYNTGNISGTGDYVGGIGGYINGYVSDCYNTGNVSGTGDLGAVGGVFGCINYGDISNCYNTGNVSGTGDYVGGISGSIGGTVSDCYNIGNVSGTKNIGGIVGENYSDIMNCYNTGKVSGTGDSVGGVVGYFEGREATNCYNTGNISGTKNIGGIVGENYSDIMNCYNTGKISGTDDVGSITGFNDDYVMVESCYWLKTGDDDTDGLTMEEMTGPSAADNMTALRDAKDADGNNVWTFMENSVRNKAEWAYRPQLIVFADSDDAVVKEDSLISSQVWVADVNNDNNAMLYIGIATCAVIAALVAVYFLFIRKS